MELALLMNSFGVHRADSQMRGWLDTKAAEHLKDWGIDSVGDRFWEYAKQTMLDGEEWYSSVHGFRFLVPVDVTFREGECRCGKVHPTEDVGPQIQMSTRRAVGGSAPRPGFLPE